MIHKPNVADQQKDHMQKKMFWLYDLIYKLDGTGKVINKEQVIGEACMKFWTRRRTILEYLKIMESTNKIRTTKTFITLVKPEEKPKEADAK